MAIVQNPVTGRTKGKFGNAVFSKQFGKNTLRSKPIEVRNPQTEGQVTQRSKFQVSLAYLRMVQGIIRVGWKSMASGKSAFNAAQSYTLQNALQLVGSDWVINPNLLLHAKGSLMKADNLTASNTGGTTIQFNWINNGGQGNALDTDKFCFVLYNTTRKSAIFQIGVVARSTQNCSHVCPADWSGDTVACYGFFMRADGSINSDDTFIMLIVLP